MHSLRSIEAGDAFAQHQIRIAFRLARHLARNDEIGEQVVASDLDDLELLLGHRPTTWQEGDAELEAFALDWAREIVTKSPTAIRMLKFAMNMVDDGLVGQQLFAGEATRLGYMTDEAAEGRDAFLAKRPKDFTKFPWHF